MRLFFCFSLLGRQPTLYDLAVPFILMMVFAGCVFPNTLAIAMGVQEKRYATASAIYCSIQFFASAIASFMASRLFKEQLYPIANMMLLIVSSFPLIFMRFQKLRGIEW